MGTANQSSKSVSTVATTMIDACRIFSNIFPDRPAFVDEHTTITWREAFVRSESLASSLLASGFHPGDRLVVQIPNSAFNLVLRLACKRAGLVVAYVPMQWRNRELSSVTTRLKARALLVVSQFKSYSSDEVVAAFQSQEPSCGVFLVSNDQVKCVVPLTMRYTSDFDRSFDDLPDITMILCSSGSTGRPKLCPWTEQSQWQLASRLIERLSLSDDDTIGIFAPLSGGAGLVPWTLTACLGTTFWIPEDLSADHLLDLIESSGLTVLATVPVVLMRLLEADEARTRRMVHKLRLIRTGTSPIHAKLLSRVEAHFGCRVLQAAGSMEVPSFAQVGWADPDHKRLSGSAGRALSGCQAAVVDESLQVVPPDHVGELILSSSYATDGYMDDPEGTKEAWIQWGDAKWLRTGDLATIDSEGFLTLMGRRHEVLNRGGNKVYSLEVERLLAQHPMVREAALVGAQDDIYGEVPYVFVTTAPGAQEEQLLAFLKESNIATYKIPVAIEIVPHLPRLPSGKIDKRSLVQQIKQERGDMYADGNSPMG